MVGRDVRCLCNAVGRFGSGRGHLGRALAQQFKRLGWWRFLWGRRRRRRGWRLVAPKPARSASIAEVHILQGLFDAEVFQVLDRGLEIVPLFAGDPQLIALDRRLHLDLASLNLLDELFR